jgi:hypothetical protein
MLQTVCNYKNRQHQNTNRKFDVNKAKIARQVNLFSMHFYDRAISVHVFAQRQREILTRYGTFFNAFYLFSQLPKTY